MSWEALRSGKVRDVFVNKEKRLIALVASDRVSAFDKILPGNGIPGKGCGKCPACKLRNQGLEKYLSTRRQAAATGSRRRAPQSSRR